MPEKKRGPSWQAKAVVHPTARIEIADGAVDVQLRGVKERDLDLFFLEEIVLNTTFREWFLGEIQLASAGRLVDAARSVNTSTGESDLEFTLREGDRLTKVLVENKIDAVLQPRQGERYRERAASYVANGKCHRAIAVLIAPASYGEKGAGFDQALTYEAVQQALTSESKEDARGRYKLLLLSAAIQRGDAGWKLIPDRAATAFWRGYWELSRSVAPELEMPWPGEKPATSNFIRFEPGELEPGVQLFHKVPYGHVDLQFAGKAGYMQAFKGAHQAHLEPDMKVCPANKSLVIRIRVGTTHVNAAFPEAEGAVREGLAAAQRLLRWYVRWMGAGSRAPGGEP